MARARSTVAACPRHQPELAIGWSHEHDRAIGVERVANGRRCLMTQQFRKRGRIDQPANYGIIGIDGGERIGGLNGWQTRHGFLRLDEIARGAQGFEHRSGERELVFGLRAGTDAAGQSSER